MEKHTSGERVHMSAHNHNNKQCAKVYIIMVMSSVHNHGCEQCAGVRKNGGCATIYYVYMYVRTPPSGGR